MKIETVSTIKVARLGNCNTLSGKGKLDYQVGYDSDSQIHFRIASNSGGGWFSGEWVSLDTIMSALNHAPKPFTSYALHGLFKGKSVNTPAFLFAALKEEGLVSVDQDNPRCYVITPDSAFTSVVQSLIDAGTELKVDANSPNKGAIKSKKTADVEPVMIKTSKSKSKKPSPG